MSTISNLRCRVALIAIVLNLGFFGSSSTLAANADILPGSSPLLVQASVLADSPGTVTVTGRNFSPNGAVYVALYDMWGTQLYETFWISASPTFYGLNGSQDPANGFVKGGLIDKDFVTTVEIFGPNGSQDPAMGYVAAAGLGCGTVAMARAFDQSSQTWSNVLDIESAC